LNRRIEYPIGPSGRSKVRTKPGPKLSRDANDKLMAALLWWIARDKTLPEYTRAPNYYDAILKWHNRLSLDDANLCAIVHDIYIRPGWGERAAKQYADKLPPVPKPPLSVK